MRVQKGMFTMALLAKYYVPGLYVEERAIDVPLDWEQNTPGDSIKGETIRLFCRVICAPEHVHDDLPLLVFLQGGPGVSALVRFRRLAMVGFKRQLSIFVLFFQTSVALGALLE